MSISIRHDISGRLRIRASRLQHSKVASTVQQAITQVEGVTWVRVNLRCAGMIVVYQPHRLTRQALLDRLREALTAVKPKGQTADSAGCSSAPSGHANASHATRRAGRRFAIISGILGGVMLRRIFWGPVLQVSALSPLGLAALVLTLPLARTGLRRLRERQVSLDGFLAAGSVAAVATGEALTAMELLWINAGAELLTTWIAERSRRSIASILEITSHHTFVLVDGMEVERRVDELRAGDIVVLHTGEKISVDGRVVSGQALINEAPITGREDLVLKRAGHEVHAGSFVSEGVIHVQAERTGDQTYLARVMHKVQCALENRAPIEGVADRLAARLVRLGLGVTLATFLITRDPWRAFSVLLVMACPCATVLAASTPISAAIAAAGRRSILIKGGRYLETIGQCNMVLFDKTGTLTTTTPELGDVFTVPPVTEAELLQAACSVEVHNHHPLAQAVMHAAQRRGLKPLAHEVCEYHLGMGMRAVFEGQEMLVGNARLMHRFNADIEPLAEKALRMQQQGLTVLYVYRNHQPAGLLGFASRLRPETQAVLQRLRNMGVYRLLLISGDEENSVAPLARRLGIEEWHAALMPEEKAAIVDQARQQGWRTLVVGDGINDALALTRADVGVAVGAAGSEVAIEAADIALAADNLEALADVYALSQNTLRIVHQNFWIATGSNIIGITLGAMGRLSPVAAGLVHIVHSLGVLLNSSRLLK